MYQIYIKITLTRPPQHQPDPPTETSPKRPPTPTRPTTRDIADKTPPETDREPPRDTLPEQRRQDPDSFTAQDPARGNLAKVK